MNYKESKKILETIKKANKILINCHRNPDADSAGGALALGMVLKEFGKDTKVVCPSQLGEDLKFLPHAESIEMIDFKKFKVSDFDLFLILDTAARSMLTGSDEKFDLTIPSISIDHHKTNTGFANVNLIDSEVSSTSELLYRIFEDWGVSIDKDIATCLFAGIVNDTGCFRYGNVTTNTFLYAADLLAKGADKDSVLQGLLRSLDFSGLKLFGEMINRSQFDEEYKFIYSAMSLDEFKKFGASESAKDLAVDFLAQAKEALFAMVIVEKEKGLVSISFRSRGAFDVSKIAVKLKGGGHVGAAGGRVVGLKFDPAVIKALETARQSVNGNKN